MNNFTFGDAGMGYYETIAGGAGAGPSWNGRSGVHTHMTNTRITGQYFLVSGFAHIQNANLSLTRSPKVVATVNNLSFDLALLTNVLTLADPEILERRYPVVLRRFCLRKASGGAGHYAGGDGVIREVGGAAHYPPAKKITLKRASFTVESGELVTCSPHNVQSTTTQLSTHLAAFIRVVLDAHDTDSPIDTHFKQTLSSRTTCLCTICVCAGGVLAADDGWHPVRASICPSIWAVWRLAGREGCQPVNTQQWASCQLGWQGHHAVAVRGRPAHLHPWSRRFRQHGRRLQASTASTDGVHPARSRTI